MRVLAIDTRQQITKHANKDAKWASLGVLTFRWALPYGDYAFVDIPDNVRDMGNAEYVEKISAIVQQISVSVDSKRDIYELAQNIQHEHKRFRAELEKARANGCKLFVLVENKDGVTDFETLAAWRESPKHYNMRKAKSGNMYARRVEGMTLAKACMTMERKYGVSFKFCHPDDSWQMVLDLLGEGANV